MRKSYIIDKQTIESLYLDKHMTLKQTSEHLSITISKLRTLIRNYDIPTRNPLEASKYASHKTNEQHHGWIVVEPELLWSLYWGNEYSMKEIAEIFDCSIYVINNRMIKYEIDKKDMHEIVRKYAFTEEVIERRRKSRINNLKGTVDYKIGKKTNPEEIRRLYWDEKKSMVQIAEMYRISTSGIKAYMKKHGIQVRNHSESSKGNKNCFGRKLSKEHVEQIRQRSIGMHPSEETRKKMALAKKLNPPKNLYKVGHIQPKGIDNPRWIKDRTKLKGSEDSKLSRSEEWKQWKSYILKRDSYTCQLCEDKNQKGRGGKVIFHCHHIFPKSEYPDLVFDVCNGIILCDKCHSSIRHREWEYSDCFLLIAQINDGIYKTKQ